MTESFVPKYVPTPVSTHNRIAKNTEEINQLLQESMHKTKTETISKVKNLKINKPVIKPNYQKLVQRYYPRLKDQLATKPKFAHLKNPSKKGWLEHVSSAAQEADKLVTISSESDDNHNPIGQQHLIMWMQVSRKT